MTRLASVQSRDRELLHGATHGIPEIDFNLVFQIAARLVFRFRGGATTPAKELAEKVAKARSTASRARSAAEIKSPKINIHTGIALACGSGIAARWQIFAIEAVLVVHLPFF